jgi:hypothetical protein
MLGLIPVSFRYRGKLRRLAMIYQCFKDNPDKALHPAQISRRTGISLAEVNERLTATPEMFVKLPKRPDGVTRYRLTSTKAAMAPEEVEKFLIRAERKESLIFYAVATMVLLVLLIVVMLVAPVF